MNRIPAGAGVNRSLPASRTRALIACGVILLLASLLSTRPTDAQTFVWNNPAGGSWSDSTNWTPLGVPTLSSQTSVFNLNSTYTVTLSAPTTTGTLSFQSGIVHFAAATAQSFNVASAIFSGGQATLGTGLSFAAGGPVWIGPSASLTLAGNSAAIANVLTIDGGHLNRKSGAFLPGPAIQVSVLNGGTLSSSGSLSFGGGTITLSAGGVLAAGSSIDLGDAAIASGTMTLVVDGAGSALSAAAPPGFASAWGIGGADVSATFRNGATASLGDLNLANSIGSVVNLSVDSGASVQLGSLRLGNGGVATFSLNSDTSSATLVGESGLAVGGSSALTIVAGTFTSGTGSISIAAGGRIHVLGGSGTARFHANGDLFVASGARLDVTDPAAVFQLAAGRTLHVQGGGSATINSPLSLAGSGAAISSGATLSVNNTLDIGAGADGTISITGGALSALTTSPVSLGAGGAAGSFTMTGGIATINGVMHVGAGSQSGSRGVVSIDGGASLTLGQLNVAAVQGSSGTVTLSGAASRVSVSRIIVGNNATAGGSATLRLSGGTLTIQGAAGLAVATSGRVELDAGTINTSSITITGGQLLSALDLPRSGANIAISQGGTMSLINGGSMAAGRTLAVGSGARLDVGGGGSLTVGMGSTTTAARLSVGGAGSHLSAPRLVVGAISGASGTVSFTAGATASIGELEVGARPGTTAGLGLMEILSGARVNVGTSLLLVSSAGASINVWGPGSALNVAGVAQLGTGTHSATLTLSSGGAFNAATLLMSGGGIVQMNGGAMSIGQFAPGSTGTINFATGTLTLPQNYTLSIAPGGLLGGSISLDATRALYAAGTTELGGLSVLRIAGGTFGTGTLAGVGVLQFESGRLLVSGGAGLSIASGHPLGAWYELGAGRSLGVGATLSIGGDGQLTQSGGSIDAGWLRIDGQYVYNGGAAAVTNNAQVAEGGMLLIAPARALGFAATIESAGEIRLQDASRLGGQAMLVNQAGGLIVGDGTVARPLLNTPGGEVRIEAGHSLRFTSSGSANQGRINLLGGTVQFTQGLINSATGAIDGRGAMLFGADGLSNGATVSLSAGVSDIFGSVSNQADGRLIVTGGATGVFHDAVSNATGSELRVSAGSTAVFLGAVSGLGAITGSGTTIFEGLASAGALLNSGTSIVQKDATLSASSIRQHGLIVRGAARVEVGGGDSRTSRVDSLIIESADANGSGRLDLNDNALIVQSATLATITSQLRNGLENNGQFDWQGYGIASTQANASNIAAGSFLYGLGVVLNDLAQVGGSGPIYTTFAGQTLSGNEILVKFTYFGDADLSGSIDATDYSLIDNGYVNTLTGWINGDFDYSGSIDATDYALIDNAYVNQAGPLAEALIAEHARMFDGEYIAALRAVQSGVIPEPGGVGACLAALLAAARRSRVSCRCARHSHHAGVIRRSR
ncbi:beta strand repeat-containing protein [Fontivita pretiosa]|uniref:beta strand repeat-containing protein n=1 Tax=Fontivita pretiosa TaxID=2989684 RepID=UPI003D1691DE